MIERGLNPSLSLFIKTYITKIENKNRYLISLTYEIKQGLFT